MNKLDPRVDSTTGAMKTSGATGTTSSTGMTGNNYGSDNYGSNYTGNAGTAEGVTGPHSSRIANAMDPRVDSDMDGSRRVGTTTGTTMTGNNYGTGAMGTNTYDSGYSGTTGSTTGTTGGLGPHSVC